ncbi:MAG TPA: amidohydrolase family protein [Solirubrobacteraceae bacterium]|nr:amidohydrolase family protein [Solirubrobacteraceae bacterium]
MSRVPGFDVHQHLWPDSFTALLAARRSPPCIARDETEPRLVLAGEPELRWDRRAHDPDVRAERLASSGLHRALLAMSSPLGIEALPRAEAQPLLDAWNDEVLALGIPFGVWGAVALDEPDPREVDALLDRGAIGISLPAEALAGAGALRRVGPLLEALERRDAPLFVHPGAAPTPAPGAPPVPAWWPALTSYPAQLQAGWLAFNEWGRPAHPSLRVLFAALAGGAPLHVERLGARGGPATAVHDPLLFYDTSSYGPRALEAAIRIVGPDALVHGSDAPVVASGRDPAHGLGESLRTALTLTNPARLLHGAAASVVPPRAGHTRAAA